MNLLKYFMPNKLSQYKFIKVLGRGHLGEVHEYEHTTTLQRVAIKTKQCKENKISSESQVLRLLNYPFFPKFIDEWEYNNVVYLAMNVIEGIELFDMINEHILDKVTDVLILFKRIVGIVSILHDNGIIHRDLKPENILIGEPHTPSSNIYIVDFEMAITLDEISSSLTIGGTKGYTPPEMFDDGVVGTFTDVWALGVILYILVSRRHPFEDEIYCHWMAIDYKDIPVEIATFLRHYIFVDYKKRMSCKDILEHPLFS